MGGYGSGRGRRYAKRTDQFHKLDLTDFQSSWFEHGKKGSIIWSRGDHVTGSIVFSVQSNLIKLTYSVGDGPDRERIAEYVPIVFTPQPFGGHRRWFSCPHCKRRCRVLYGEVRFACRQCFAATYPTQYDRIRFPNLAKAEKARQRVGGEPGILNPFSPKPKHMHWRTYRRLEALHQEAERAVARALHAMCR